LASKPTTARRGCCGGRRALLVLPLMLLKFQISVRLPLLANKSPSQERCSWQHAWQLLIVGNNGKSSLRYESRKKKKKKFPWGCRGRIFLPAEKLRRPSRRREESLCSGSNVSQTTMERGKIIISKDPQ
jgi:hypothetical protein